VETAATWRGDCRSEALVEALLSVIPEQETAGDFPTVCYEAIASRKSVTEPDDLTVDGVNTLLDKLSRGKSQ
jgi:hypothetical protein